LAALRRTVAESIFISSCSRRELARRRPTRNQAVRLQLLAVLLVIAAALATLVISRGGF
jgi:hypothetical protein